MPANGIFCLSKIRPPFAFGASCCCCCFHSSRFCTISGLVRGLVKPQKLGQVGFLAGQRNPTANRHIWAVGVFTYSKTQHDSFMM